MQQGRAYKKVNQTFAQIQLKGEEKKREGKKKKVTLVSFLLDDDDEEEEEEDDEDEEDPRSIEEMVRSFSGTMDF